MQLDTSELRYKEYKAYVPPKWAAFDKAGKLGGGLNKKEKGFAHYLSGGGVSKVNHAELQQVEDAYSSGSDDGDDDDGAAAGAAGGRPKKSEEWKRNWTENMVMYVKQQELKAEAKQTTLQLQGKLKDRAQKVQKRREREVEAPVLASISAKSSFMAQRKVDEAAAMKHNTLLRAAIEANHAHNRDKVDVFYAEKQAKRRDDMNKHLDKLATVEKEHTRALKEQSQSISHNASYRESIAHRNREQLSDQKATQLQREHEAALKKDASIQRKRELAASDRHTRLVEKNVDIARRVSNSKQKLDEKRQKFESKLTHGFEDSSTRLMLLEAKRKQKVDQNLTGKALIRAAAARDEARRIMLADCEKMEKRRETQLEQKETNDKDAVAELKAKNASRIRISDNVLDTQWRDRSRTIDDSIELHHRPVPKRETPEYSETLMDLQRHIEQKKVVDAEKAQRRHEEELRAMNMEKEATQRGNRESMSRHRAYLAAEEHRLITRGQAEERKQAFEETTTETADKRRDRSDKHLADYMKDRDADLKQRSMEKSTKIANSLELVNVQKHNDLVKELRTKEKRQRQKKTEKATAHETRVTREREERDLKQAHMTSMIQGEQRRKDQRNEQNMQTFKEKARVAQAQRDDHLDEIRLRLGSQYKSRVSMTEAAARKREQDFVDGCVSLQRKDDRWTTDRDNQLEERALERKQRAMEKQRTIDEHREEASNQVLDKANRTIDKLERAYSQGPGSPVHPHSEQFGGFSAIRARSALN